MIARPEMLVLLPDGALEANQLPCTVRRCQYLGARTVYSVEADGGIHLRVETHDHQATAVGGRTRPAAVRPAADAGGGRMMGPRHNRVWFWLTALVLSLFCVFLLYPLVQVIASSLAASEDGRSGWRILISDPKYRSAVVNTLLLGLTVTITSTLIGVPLAFFTARFSFPGKALIAILPMTTLIVPEVIAAQTWLMVLGNNGFLTRWLGSYDIDIPSFYGWPGLVTVMTFIYYTYVYIGTLAAIRGFDGQLEEASQSLGVPPGRTLLKVMLPVVAPAIMASAILVFTLVVGNFAVAIILGHRVNLLSVLTYQSFVSEVGANPVMQSTLASVSIAIVACVLFLQRWVLSRGRFEIVQGRGTRPWVWGACAPCPWPWWRASSSRFRCCRWSRWWWVPLPVRVAR